MTLFDLEYAACDPKYIEQISQAFVQEILEKKETLEAVVEHLTDPAVRSFGMTRTVALVVKKMLQQFSWRKPADLEQTFKDEVLDLAVATYINCWKIALMDDPETLAEISGYHTAADSLVVSAYIGDLYAMEILSEPLFHTCICFLLERFTNRFHLKCLELMLIRSNSYTAPPLEPSFLFRCLGCVRKRCGILQMLKEVTDEEHELKDLLYRFIFQQFGALESDRPRYYYPDALKSYIQATRALSISSHSSNPGPSSLPLLE